MLKIFLGILAVILAVALLTNNSEERALPRAPVMPAAGTQDGAAAAEGAGGAAVNPAHGQPGHRCDIAVGAPLPGSAPAAPATPENVSPRKSDAGVVLNPAHGQPGHDCSVPVGKPLPQ